VRTKKVIFTTKMSNPQRDANIPAKILARILANGKCMSCGVMPDKTLHVHRINGPNYSHSNVRVLCSTCHNKEERAHIKHLPPVTQEILVLGPATAKIKLFESRIMYDQKREARKKYKREYYRRKQNQSLAETVVAEVWNKEKKKYKEALRLERQEKSRLRASAHRRRKHKGRQKKQLTYINKGVDDILRNFGYIQ
jgi:hypothetical protein